ncbi:DUF2721 domain-containing protein [soil metagenome]
MQTVATITSVAQVIQQAVAPVFLLTGVGTILAVLTSRLSRVVDRFRALDTSAEREHVGSQEEMVTLLRRASWIHRAITLCTLCALFICIVITVLFIGSELHIDPSGAIALLFITATLALIAGLLCFLREISLATEVISLRKRE